MYNSFSNTIMISIIYWEPHIILTLIWRWLFLQDGTIQQFMVIFIVWKNS